MKREAKLNGYTCFVSSTLQLVASGFTKLSVVLGIAVKYLGNHTNPLKW